MQIWLVVPLAEDPPPDIVYSLERILSLKRARNEMLSDLVQKLNTDLWLWPLVNLCRLNNPFKS